jgi:hypothetical protein
MQGKISQRLDKIVEIYDQDELALEAYNYFKNITPYLTGNAQNKTQLKGNSIIANYAYAVRLNEGYSRKARDGMVKPTIEHMQQYIRKQR